MRFSTLAVAVAIAPFATAQNNTIEEVVVTSSFTNSSLTATTVVVSGDTISGGGSQALGEHLSTLVGVSSNNFGPAVGQPVIRGMSGNRVKVLQNGLVVRDVSGIGPDHPNDINLNNIQQLEVIRGAAALLSSNGASGGIINIVDNTIARSDVEEASAYVGAESQSVTMAVVSAQVLQVTWLASTSATTTVSSTPIVTTFHAVQSFMRRSTTRSTRKSMTMIIMMSMMKI